MTPSDKPPSRDQQRQVVAEARQYQAQREQGYRERALKLFAPVCARCGRDFAGKRLRELTVHHKDHNHGNNPPDGSNWELLCLYCHDNEHSRYQDSQWNDSTRSDESPGERLTQQPFAGLARLRHDD